MPLPGSHHLALGVVEAFDLEQGPRASHLVGRAGLAQHQALGALGLDPGELALEVFDPLAGAVRDRGDVLRGAAVEHLVEGPQALLEHGVDAGDVEDQVAYLAPIVALVLASDDADSALEGADAAIKLAVERRRREAPGEPVGREVEVAEARDQALAVPVGAHPVELLAHPPAGDVDVVGVAVGEEQLRSDPSGGGARGGCRHRGPPAA